MSAKIGLGTRAPGFELPRDGGGSLSLANLAGRKVVLYFYPKDDTSGCTQEAIEFNGRRAEFEKLGATVVGVSPDKPASHDKFKSKHGLELALVSDETKKMLEDYGVWVEKSMYGRKYMGVERTTFLIDEKGKIVRIWNKVKPAGHAQEVLDAVRQI